MTDQLRYKPDPIVVREGEMVRFIVKNDGAIDHEFYIGDERAQLEHEGEMEAMGSMHHHDDNGVSVGPGKTEVLVTTFREPGSLLVGCHEPGHYAGGMKALLIVR